MESTSGVAAGVAVLSGTLLALLGVDYYALLWATIASLAALLFTPKTTRIRASAIVSTSALLGAALGTAMAEHLGGSRSVVMVCSILCATGARPIIVVGVDAIVTQVRKRAGVEGDRERPPNP